jgi:hypothetical protein
MTMKITKVTHASCDSCGDSWDDLRWRSSDKVRLYRISMYTACDLSYFDFCPKCFKKLSEKIGKKLAEKK